jgi:hypothetical protein
MLRTANRAKLMCARYAKKNREKAIFLRIEKRAQREKAKNRDKSIIVRIEHSAETYAFIIAHTDNRAS